MNVRDSVACNHAWETVEQCFECGAIRPAQDEPKPILDDELKGCPMKAKPNDELEQLRRMIRELTGRNEHPNNQQRDSPSITSYTTSYDAPVCPCCGAIDQDWWLNEESQGDELRWEHTCPKCQRRYVVYFEMVVEFRTWELE